MRTNNCIIFENIFDLWNSYCIVNCCFFIICVTWMCLDWIATSLFKYDDCCARILKYEATRRLDNHSHYQYLRH
jgi:hypothetical protein